MRDDNGIYYLVQPGNSDVRVYVRRGVDGEVEFRLWNRQFPDVWDRHPWLSMQTLSQAANLYRQERNPDINPLKLYDLAVARALLDEENS